MTDGQQQPCRLYPRLLGADWASLHPYVQRAHTHPGSGRAQARFVVTRAPGRLLGLLLDLARVPAAADDVQVQLVVVERMGPDGPQERWHRVFGGKPLVTQQAEARNSPGRPSGLLGERIGPLEFRFRLLADASDGSLLFDQQGCWLRVGPLALRLPHRLSPAIWCRESATGNLEQTCVFVKVTLPRGGPLFSYRGTVTWHVTRVTR
jgi:hypothetical protein